MTSHPTAQELGEAIDRFLEKDVAPGLSTHASFVLRVARNSLATIVREAMSDGEPRREEQTRLQRLIGRDGSIEDLNAEFCRRIRSGTVSLGHSGVFEHIRSTTMDRVAIDQPEYSGLRIAKERLGI